MLNNPFLSGHVALAATDVCCEDVAWNRHPAFAGVSLRHLVTGSETQGQFSTHMVRVEPGCVLDTHRHGGCWEFHAVVAGNARCELADRKTEYGPGVCGVIPQDMPHRVVAGEHGVYILATFVPALL